MKIKTLYIYPILFTIHAIISVYAFDEFVFNPTEISFNNSSDGLKNDFTLYTYVNDPIDNKGVFKYSKFNYPFGDYVYSTDNTPAFSVPFRWFCQNVWDLSDYAIPIFYYLIILNIIIAGPLIFYIFKSFLPNNLFAFIAAIIFPWVNTQLPRIWNGHYNLSLSSLILLAFCLLILWHKHRYNKKNLLFVGIVMWALCFFSFLQHGYFIAIVTLFIAGSLFFYGIVNRKESFAIPSFIASFLVPIGTVGLALLLLHQTDPYLSLRKEGAMGYDFHEMKTRFYSFFTPYYFHSFYFPIRSVYDGNHEHAGYLGNISLYACTIIGLISIRNRAFRASLKQIQIDFFSNKFNLALMLGALMMLSISFGEKYWTGPDGYLIYNILNPFFYIHIFTDAVEQFRSLARFNWPFYFAFNVWAFYTIYRIFEDQSKKVKKLMLFGIILIGYVELKDFINATREYAVDENLLNAKHFQKFDQLKLKHDKYQAIMPIPYYNAGSEDYDYTLDDYELWSAYTYQLSIYTNLPLMSGRMSRTPPIYIRAIIDLFSQDKMYGFLYDKLNDKPILITANKNYMDIHPVLPQNEVAKQHYMRINDFIARKNLVPIDSIADVYFYEWYPKAAYKK